jgi:hypothetical protein
MMEVALFRLFCAQSRAARAGALNRTVCKPWNCRTSTFQAGQKI